MSSTSSWLANESLGRGQASSGCESPLQPLAPSLSEKLPLRSDEPGSLPFAKACAVAEEVSTMSVKVRRYNKRGKSGWEVDIVLKMPDGEVLRERVKAPVSSKSGAKYWGEQREAELLRNGKPQKREVATLEQFVPRFLEGYVQANRQKPSAVNGTQSILRKHLLPMFGKKRLDQIDDEDIQRLKGKLRNRSVKSVNNVLTVLSTILKVAAKWKVTERMHAQIESLKVPPPGFSFYEFDEYEALRRGRRALRAGGAHRRPSGR